MLASKSHFHGSPQCRPVHFCMKYQRMYSRDAECRDRQNPSAGIWEELALIMGRWVWVRTVTSCSVCHSLIFLCLNAEDVCESCFLYELIHYTHRKIDTSLWHLSSREFPCRWEGITFSNSGEKQKSRYADNILTNKICQHQILPTNFIWWQFQPKEMVQKTCTAGLEQTYWRKIEGINHCNKPTWLKCALKMTSNGINIKHLAFCCF